MLEWNYRPPTKEQKWNGHQASQQYRELEDSGEGRDKAKLKADSCWCLAETHTILYNNYPSIKSK